jgi:glycosyltransferase involved in cell wall biosynthesis
MIRILYIDTSRYFGAEHEGIGGAEEGLRLLLSRLDRNLFETWICLDFPMPYANFFKGCNTHLVFRTKSLFWRKIEVMKLPRIGLGLLQRIYFAFKLALRLIQIRPRIVHINLFRNKCFLDILTSKLLGVKVVIHVRSLSSQTPFQKWVLNLCDAIICPSETVKKDVSATQTTTPVFMVYNGIDFSKYKNLSSKNEARRLLQLPKDKKLIFSIGRLEPRKGHDIAIQAFSLLKNALNDTALVIVGGESSYTQGQELNRLKELSKHYNLDENIFFLGHINKMSLVYASADVVFALSRDGEAFGRIPVEAAIAQKPVVATNRGATPELIIHGETGFLVEPSEIMSICNYSIELLTDEKKYKSIAQSAEIRAKKLFDDKQCAINIENIYQILI